MFSRDKEEFFFFYDLFLFLYVMWRQLVTDILTTREDFKKAIKA